MKIFWCEVSPTPTSFRRWHKKHKSKICFQDLHFILLDKKIWWRKSFRKNNLEPAENFKQTNTLAEPDPDVGSPNSMNFNMKDFN